MAPWQHVVSSLGIDAGTGSLLMCVTVVVLALAGGLIPDDRLNQRCERMLILLLHRKGAKEILKFRVEPPGEGKQPAAPADSAETEAGPPKIALESVPDPTIAPAKQQLPAQRRRSP